MEHHHHGNHNDYRGPLLAMIDLSQVTAINATDFDVIDLPKKRWDSGEGGGGDHHFAGLREFKLSGRGDEWVGADHPLHNHHLLLRRLTELTVSLGGILRDFVQAMPTHAAVNLCRLSLLNCSSLLTEVVQQLVVPLTTTTDNTDSTTTTTTISNVRLEELRVAWNDRYYMFPAPTFSSSPVVSRFPALTTLHLVKSTLLHR